jgi:GAF domain-containing protein
VERTEGKYSQSLYRAAAEINSTHTPAAILNYIVESVAKAIGARGCSVMLLSPDRKLLLHTATYGLSDQYIRKGPISADRSISHALLGEPVAILDATKDERVQYQEQARKEGIVSILSVPMTLRNEIIGVIRVYTADQRYFTLDDIYFTAAVANLGAIALENARLYESVHKDYEELRLDMLEWRAALGDDWLAQDSTGRPKEPRL